MCQDDNLGTGLTMTCGIERGCSDIKFVGQGAFVPFGGAIGTKVGRVFGQLWL